MLGPFSGCLGPCRGEVENHMGCQVGFINIFHGTISVFRRFERSIWSQVGDIIGVLGGKPDKIETRWLGELDLEDHPRVLGGLGWFVGDVPRGLGGPGRFLRDVPRGLRGPGRFLRDVPRGLGGPVGRESSSIWAPHGSEDGFWVLGG
jgi:hypothetical protein